MPKARTTVSNALPQKFEEEKNEEGEDDGRKGKQGT